MRKKAVVSYSTTVRKNGLLFIPTSGHTGFDLLFGGTQKCKKFDIRIWIFSCEIRW